MINEKLPLKARVKLYKTVVVRPTTCTDLSFGRLTKNKIKTKVAKMRTPRWTMCGVTRLDRVRNE